MRFVNLLRKAALIVSVTAATMGGAAFAAQDVQMLNKAPDSKERNVFYPAVVKIQPGETVNWLSKDKGHNVEFVKGAIPDGVQPFRSKINEDVSYTFEQPGVYVYKCTPHYGLGMVGIIIVGDEPANLAEAAGKKYPGKAGKRLSAMFAEIGG